jgi:DNA-binding NarL/FixJ family response regulator
MRIFIADDHEIFRRGLRALLESRPGWEICGEAKDGKQAVAKVRDLDPDIIVLDISMPGLNGLQVTKRLIQSRPSSKVIILSQHEPSLFEASAREAGAQAYLTKTDVAQKLISAIEELVVAG